MKKLLLASAVGLSLVSGLVCAETVRDVRDLREAHQHIQESIKEMERVREANHYDVGGHAAKAETLLKQAERELNEATESHEHAK